MKFILVATFLFIVFCFHCVSVPPGTGGSYMYNDFKSTQLTFQVPQGDLMGSSSGECYASMVCLGDTTVSSAAKAGGIDIVSSVEYRYFSIFIFYSKTTTIVHGNKKDPTKK
jgi:hypothetical protein